MLPKRIGCSALLINDKLDISWKLFPSSIFDKCDFASQWSDESYSPCRYGTLAFSYGLGLHGKIYEAI